MTKIVRITRKMTNGIYAVVKKFLTEHTRKDYLSYLYINVNLIMLQRS